MSKHIYTALCLKGGKQWQLFLKQKIKYWMWGNQEPSIFSCTDLQNDECSRGIYFLR